MSGGATGLLLGGIGLFLLGMILMTDGLKTAAGPTLDRVLAASTQTRLRGLFSGIFITALVQSSSAVTVAAIGFVNAGLMSFSQSLWVLFGANVGTTMTGWLVALIGLKIKVEAAALPLIGIGMALRLSGAEKRRGAIGTTLTGFGILAAGDWTKDEDKRADTIRGYTEAQRIGPLLLGDYYPLTPYSLDKNSWIAWQFHRADLNEGVVQAFRRPEAENESLTVRLRGLNPQQHYEIEDFDGDVGVRTGAELMNGYTFHLPQRPAAAVFRLKRLERTPAPHR